MSELLNLEPKGLWKHFDKICSIPHPSKHEEKIVAALVEFAKENNIEYKLDEVGNVIMRKPATKGMENRKGVILQAHCDMVPQKNNDTKHDFLTDPILPRIEGEWVKATGTTLGADNGIGVAVALAVLEDKTLEHGPIEALITIDEETGMTGAFGLKAGELEGDILLNLDSETEGELYVGCAGGIDATITFDYTTEAFDSSYKAFALSIKGLKGGHSGMDIILQRGNANKILFRILKALEKVDVSFSTSLSNKSHTFVPGNCPIKAFFKVYGADSALDYVISLLFQFFIQCRNYFVCFCFVNAEDLHDILSCVMSAHLRPSMCLMHI